jgi:hypothetical protein
MGENAPLSPCNVLDRLRENLVCGDWNRGLIILDRAEGSKAMASTEPCILVGGYYGAQCLFLGANRLSQGIKELPA